MAQNKEQLQALLGFIGSLAKQPENAWFKEELSRNFSLSNISDDKESVDVFMKILHDRYLKKARKYYEQIKEEKLKKQLIRDHADMLWYKAIYEFEKYLVCVYYQIENMLNYYFIKTSAISKIKSDASKYNYDIRIKENYSIKGDLFIKIKDNDEDESKIVNKISIWDKIIYWEVETNRGDFLEKMKTNINTIINARNYTNHANYTKTFNPADYFRKQDDDTQQTFIEFVIKEIRNTIILI